MHLNISGKDVNRLGSSMQKHISNKVNEVVTKYLKDAISVFVRFAKQKMNYSCSIFITKGKQKQVIKCSERAYDIHGAFDNAFAKLEPQLKKHKSKLKNNHRDKIKLSAIIPANTDI